MAGESLCIGDHICLYSEENFGYVYALQSRFVAIKINFLGCFYLI